VLDVTRGTPTRVVVNDRLDVALACGADGVHLRASSISPQAARRIAPAAFLVGRSVHSVQEAQRIGGGVTYLIAGTVWRTVSKPAGGTLLGPSGLADIVAAASVPVVAIGGITAERAAAAAATGAAGVAGIGLFMADAEPSAGTCRAKGLNDTVAALRAAVDTSPPHP
jgi:thiamine-phosphate pyrophosphorylase